jgi:hypothetical protein
LTFTASKGGAVPDMRVFQGTQLIFETILVEMDSIYDRVHVSEKIFLDIIEHVLFIDDVHEDVTVTEEITL